MSELAPIRLNLNGRIQPRDAEHNARLMRALTSLHDELRLMGCDVAIAIEDSPALRVIVVEVGELATITPGRAVA